MRDENDWVELLRERDARIANLEPYEARNYELSLEMADMTAQWLDASRRVTELEALLDEVTTRWRDTVATEDGGK